MAKYKGSSKAQDANARPTLELALLNAYEEGMKGKPKGTGRTFSFKVEAIFVEGDNPPSDYRVELSDHG